MRIEYRAVILAVFGLILLALGLLSARPQATTASHLGTVSAGALHSCALTTEGGVKCWGRNSLGQLGDGTNDDSAMPIDVIGLESGVVAISAGGTTSCALTASTVECWGGSYFGATAAEIVGLDSPSAVNAGFNHSCAIVAGGTVQCWGSNSHGQLGDGTTDGSPTPVDVVGLGAVTSISAGLFHSCAVTTLAAVRCWGQNNSGQLGDGTFVERLTPVDIQGLSSGAVSVEASGTSSCALDDGGGVTCWGSDAYGQLGDGGGCGDACTAPTNVTGLGSGVLAISLPADGAHACALLAAAKAQCWGNNFFGQLGDGTDGLGTNRSTPVDVIHVSNDLAAVSAGGLHSCALTLAGGITCWGNDWFSQLGDSDGDGCTDLAENGTNEMLGGQRNPFNRWDFFDVWTHPIGQPTVWIRDEVVNLPGDIMGVANRFGANDVGGSAEVNRDTDPLSLPPDEGYHPAFDRGLRDGPNAWNRLPADGFINVPDDIIGVASQFGHSCA